MRRTRSLYTGVGLETSWKAGQVKDIPIVLIQPQWSSGGVDGISVDCIYIEPNIESL